jgi:aldehyde:ferredoxin oxidoreductase
LLEARFGSQASLRIGSAGIGGVAFASLASGGARPSFVGRGGLGAVLGASGLCAVVVRAEPEPPRKPAQALVEALTSSPRLAQRSAQGTTELWHALSARGELNAMEDDSPLDPERGVALARSAREAGRERHGCRGCPTPCGWVFERSTGERQRSHFGAAHAVGPALGLDDFDDSLTLLARCDALGVDAKEAGAVLATWGRAVDAGVVDGPDPRGDVDALVATLDRLIEDPRARSGAAHLARELGLDLARLPWLDGLERPAPGQLVWWHENLVAALDASGFCAFSAAGTLADGVLDLDRLAQALGHVDGDELLALGASIVLARRSLETRWGIGGERDRPSALVERLDRPEMLPAYRAARGIDADGAPLGEVWENLGRRRLARPWAAPVLEATAVEIEPARASLAEHSPTAVVEITVRATGTLADALGAPVGLQLFPGATVGDLMGELARRHPNAERLLGEPVRSPVSVWRAGLRLDVDTALVDGDRIDLVLAIAGG